MSFRVGEKIRVLVNYYVGCMPNGDGPRIGDILEVVDVKKCTTPGNWIDKYTAEVDQVNLYGTTEFALLVKDESIARPILEERKIGKVRMDLFNEGFPNAVLEIAKVMTWANQNKGYKDHDWKNLPDADKNLPAAASRHGIKQLIQKSKGVPAIDRVDEESKIVHKAHEAFNILAELELVLTGVIK